MYPHLSGGCLPVVHQQMNQDEPFVI